ncbi:MAG TPA: PAS domain S-box protein [Pyrinomonadaceae bacterium]|nr:PAS domain S-box protein [Pyrinomonadaceae bacterium]
MEEKNKSARAAEFEAPLAPYWLPAIIESADDAIISKTLDGIITSWNKAAERIFGYTAEEVIGKPILIIIPQELHDEETQILSRIRNGERTEHFETIRLHKNGTLLHVSLTISPIRTPDGKIIGASKIARNITDRIQAEEERQRLLQEAEQARREAEAANLAKDQFLALLSHELRTPLHSMKGWLSMLGNGLLNDEQQRKALDVIKRGIEAQNALIEDLLDVSRIASGKLSISRDRLSLVSTVSQSVELLRPIAASHGITLDSNLDIGADEILGDSHRLQQVINNLINNAIKFTSPGGQILVRLERDYDKARLTVKDTGIGIQPEMLARIFEKFEQGDSSSRRNFGGLGLGLTIARHLAELHGGDVTGHSEGSGKGSTFTVMLPLMRTYAGRYFDDNSSTEADAWRDIQQKILANISVLIVEDDFDSLEMLRVSLESSGASVTSVDRSDKAVEALKARPFDIMISDLGLPEMDGYDLIREIRDGLRLSPVDLPAVALSGYASDEDRQRSEASGFQLHLQKPLDIALLPRTIRNVIGKS